MAEQDKETYQERFLHLLEEAGSLDMLRWSRHEVEAKIQQFCATRAHCLGRGDRVEVMEGPAAGRRGRVLGHGSHEENLILVELEGMDLGEPVPIPATALRLAA